MFIVIKLLEFVAAITGTFYLKKEKKNLPTRCFVYFLWLTFFVEIIGMLPRAINHLEGFSFLKDTFLEKNHWLYNAYHIISFLFYITYFKLNLGSKKIRTILDVLSVVYFVLTISYLITIGGYFKSLSTFTYIVGSILIFLCILLYFYEVIQSDTILSFHTNLTFYVAIGAMLFHLIVTPLFIYSEYYLGENPEFVKVRRIILYSANIFLYTCYTIGFIVCSRKNKSY